MKPLTISKGRGRLLFDPSTGYIRLDHDGAGIGMELTVDEMVTLSRQLWYSAKGR